MFENISRSFIIINHYHLNYFDTKIKFKEYKIQIQGLKNYLIQNWNSTQNH